MSKIGKMPVSLPQDVSVTLSGRLLTIKGSKGELTFTIPVGISVVVKDGAIHVARESMEGKNLGALFGTVRATIANMVRGVSEGFEKKLELSGVGYRASLSGSNLTLSVGFSHPVTFAPINGTSLTTVDNVIVVKGVDKALVGKMAASIRAVRPPEPYKGKGIRYQGEKIRRKAGKAAKAVGAK